MRLKENQTRYVATKIGIDLANAPFVRMPKGKEAVVSAIKALIDENLKSERALDDKVKKILDENDDEIEFQHANERQLFFMIKKKLAPQYGVIMNYDDRYNDLSHKILDELYEEYLLEYDVNENQVKNVIFKGFKDFANAFEKIDDTVYKKIKAMKREVIPGTQEYELIYERLYEEELKKRGML
ncbi:MAG: competence protein [Sulfurovum sp. FS08-3]|nr:MAG: competence protein [Sulfurovum sp. FS08-3]